MISGNAVRNTAQHKWHDLLDEVSEVLHRHKSDQSVTDITSVAGSFPTKKSKKKSSILRLKSTYDTERSQGSADVPGRQSVVEYRRDLFAQKQKSSRRGYPCDSSSATVTRNNKPKQLQDVYGGRYDEDEIKLFVPPVFPKSEDEIRIIKRAIDSNVFMGGLQAADDFVAAFEPLRVDHGTVVIEQGEEGDYFYVIVSGAVTFHVDGARVGGATAGTSFGELALLYTSPRAATVVAAGSTKLCRVDHKTFQILLQTQMTKSEMIKIRLLRGVPMFSEQKKLTDNEIQRLSARMMPHIFEAGESLTYSGLNERNGSSEALYIIHEGNVLRNQKDVLTTGDFFGGWDYYGGLFQYDTADLYAISKVNAFKIERLAYEEVVGELSLNDSRKLVCDALEQVDAVKENSVLSRSTNALSKLSVDESYTAGAKIISDSVAAISSSGVAIYVVKSGCVKLEGDRNETIQRGGCFGEDLLSASVRLGANGSRIAYTATAEEDCVLKVLTVADCHSIITSQITLDDFSESSVWMSQYNAYDGDTEDVTDRVEEESLGAYTKCTETDFTHQWLKSHSKLKIRQTLRKKSLGDFDRHFLLGEGQFGDVWRVSCDIGAGKRKNFALKTQAKHDPMRKHCARAIRQEIAMLDKVDHPFIVTLYHWYEDENHFHMLMQEVSGGELFEIIHQEHDDGNWYSGLPEADGKFYCLVIADTLDYIHSMNIAYRDLKPENVLIDRDGYPVITDFGFAKHVPDKTFTFCGTPSYLAPEIVTNRGHNQAVDHWALGVLIYEIITGENPYYYDGMEQLTLFKAIAEEPYYPFPEGVSRNARDLVAGLLMKNPNKRLGSLAGRGKDILRHPWFRPLQLTQLRNRTLVAPFLPVGDDIEEESSVR